MSLLPVPGRGLVPTPTGSAYAETSDSIFRTAEVSRVDITIAPADLQDMLDHPTTDLVKTCTVRWRNTRIDETLANVSIRIRGNTSRTANRKSWRLDFNDQVAGRKFHGLQAANLNGDPNDPTFLRSTLAWQVVRDFGVPGCRTNLVALYFNGTFWSLQNHVENIDDQFVDRWFGNQTGNLYKCVYEGARADLGFVSGENYAAVGGGRTYTEHINTATNDFTDLRDLIRLITQQTDPTILAQLDSRFDVDSYLRAQAIAVSIGGWDDYWYGSNNYWLYHDAASNRLSWMPWDLDNSIGTDYFNTDWSTRNYSNWGSGGFGSDPAPLTRPVFAQAVWKNQYRRYLLQLATMIESQAMYDRGTELRNLIRPYYNGQIESGGTVGNSPAYKDDGLDRPTTWSGGSPHSLGIHPFFLARASSLRSQIGTGTPALPALKINEVLASNNSINVDEAGDHDDWIEIYNAGATSVDLTGMSLAGDVRVPFSYQFPATTTLAAGAFLIVWADGETTEGLRHAPYTLDTGPRTLGLYHNATNGRVLIDSLKIPAQLTDRSYGRYPNGADTLQLFETVTPAAANSNATHGPPRTPPNLRINEFMASNSTTVGDEFGEKDDWIEIYNAESTAVDLSGLHLTDDLANPTKGLIPVGVVIPAHGFLVFWADDQVAQGARHMPFKLSGSGESIGLYDNDENRAQLIDSTTFGVQTSDISTGRLPDGAGGFQLLARPSPGQSNAAAGDGWTVR